MGLVAFIYSGIGGLAIGAVVAAMIASARKSKNPDSSLFATFIASVCITVPLFALAILMMFVVMWS